MTDQLRERIAQAIYASDCEWCKFVVIPWDETTPGTQARYRKTAQAVIDELGLTVETASTASPPVVIDRPAGFTNEHIEMITGGRISPTRTRVVGRWEDA